jgi:hypothetical protein
LRQSDPKLKNDCSRSASGLQSSESKKLEELTEGEYMRRRIFLLFVTVVLFAGFSSTAFGQVGEVAGGIGAPPPISLPSHKGPLGSEDNPVRVSSGLMAQRIAHQETPHYPDTHETGVVVMHAIVDKSGKIDTLIVVSGPKTLRGAALESVRHWTYKPHLLNGEAVFVETIITVNFVRSEG